MKDYDKYIIARFMYSIGKEDSFLNDAEYNALEKIIKRDYPDSPYLNQSWSSDECPKELLIENGMEEYIKNVKLLHKSESMASINEEGSLYALESTADRLGGRISYKDDGFHIILNYYNGKYIDATKRGRSIDSFIEATAIQHIVPKEIPIMGVVRISGEAVIPNSLWDDYKGMTGNISQRSSVETALSRGDYQFLSFHAFKIETKDKIEIEDTYVKLKEMGFKTPTFMMVKNFSGIKKAIELLSKRKVNYDSPTDGLVFENKEMQTAIRLGGWKEERNITFITGYEENRGVHGNSINLLIYPVTMTDKVVRRVTVQNVANIVEGDLRIGSLISFNMRSGTTGVYNSVETEELRLKYPNPESMIKSIKSRD